MTPNLGRAANKFAGTYRGWTILRAQARRISVQFAPEVNKTDARNRLPKTTASTRRSMQTASSKQISNYAAVAVTSVLSAT